MRRLWQRPVCMPACIRRIFKTLSRRQPSHHLCDGRNQCRIIGLKRSGMRRPVVGPIGLHGADGKDANGGHAKGGTHMGDAGINTNADSKIWQSIAKSIEMLNRSINHFHFATGQCRNRKSALTLRFRSRHQCNRVPPVTQCGYHHTHALVIQLLGLFRRKGHEQRG